jgi:hypothetical protein
MAQRFDVISWCRAFGAHSFNTVLDPRPHGRVAIDYLALRAWKVSPKSSCETGKTS